MAFFRDLFGLDDSQQAHEQIFGSEPRHHSSWTHEMIAGAAGFAALKAYEYHVRKSAAAEVDKLFESKGLDFVDREKAKLRATHQAHNLAEHQYGAGGTFNL